MLVGGGTSGAAVDVYGARRLEGLIAVLSGMAFLAKTHACKDTFLAPIFSTTYMRDVAPAILHICTRLVVQCIYIKALKLVSCLSTTQLSEDADIIMSVENTLESI